MRPRDGTQFVKLFADAQFYTCPIPSSIPQWKRALTKQQCPG